MLPKNGKRKLTILTPNQVKARKKRMDDLAKDPEYFKRNTSTTFYRKKQEKL